VTDPSIRATPVRIQSAVQPPVAGAAVRARVGISVVFAVHGAVYGTFATRIPWIADRLHAGPGPLGLALIAPAVGAIVAMPLAARVMHRFRSRPTMLVLLLIWCGALLLPALAPNLVLLFVALFGFGAASGMADVAMNAQGVVVEQAYGRSIMSGLHGLWSAGGLLASGIGAVAAQSDVDARLHFAGMAVLLGLAGWWGCRRLLDVGLPAGDHAPAFAWPSRAVLAIGLVGFCAVFVEGGSAEWCAVYLRTITHAAPGLAAAAFTAFAFSMTAARLVGDRIVRRFGPVATVRVGGVVASTGAVLVLVSRQPAPALVGFGLIGLGVAVVVPLAFAAAGTIGPNPAQAIAGIATIAYGAGLAAPGAIGGIAAISSLPVSFGLIAGLCVVLVFTAGALQRPAATAP